MTLLAAARQALPGLEWDGDDGGATTKVQGKWIGVRVYRDGAATAWTDVDNGVFDSAAAAAQWLRAQVTDRRDALDAALGESDRGEERQAAVAIAAACLDTGLVPQGVSGTVEAVRAVCDRAKEAEAREAWAPVTERLPPLGQEVDLWDGFGRLPDYHRDGDKDLWEWFNVNGDPIGDVPGTGEPTHWREKPLPPNG